MSTAKKDQKQKTSRNAETLVEWMERRYAERPEMREQVEAIVKEMEIEQQLVALREERGLSQTAVAQRLGVSQPAVAKIESGREKNLAITTLVKYAAAVGATVSIKFHRDARTGRFVVLRGGRRTSRAK
jgi:DNA-binding XRE family transcriptional regulator